MLVSAWTFVGFERVQEPPAGGLDMPLLDFSVCRVIPLVFWRVLVGKVKVIAVIHVVVFTASSCLGDSPNYFPVFFIVPVCEQRSNTQIPGVFIHHFDVLCRPGKAWSFAEPANTSPEINALFYSSFFAFVARDLR